MDQTKVNPYLQLLEIPPGHLNTMGYVDESEVNGPGSRAVVWLQGCLRECEGCFNPNSLVSSSNQQVHVFNSELQDKLDWASDRIEIHILEDGSRIITGFRGTLS